MLNLIKTPSNVVDIKLNTEKRTTINHEQQFNIIKEAIKKSTNISELMSKLNTIADENKDLLSDNRGYRTKILIDSTRSIKREYPESDIVFIEHPHPKVSFEVCARGVLPFIMKHSNLRGCTLHYVSKGKYS